MTDQSNLLEPIGPVHTGCLHCGSRPETMPLDAALHPGFGGLDLTRDGETPDWWREFEAWPTEPHCWGSWETGTIKVGPRKGQQWHDWIGGEIWWRLTENLTLADVEECCAEDPDHDWRIHIHGPMYGVVYQRHGAGQWCAAERLDGFA